MRLLRFVPVVLAFALAAAGCAGRGEATGDQSSSKDGEEAMLAFAQCMREHGIDMPDPEVEGGGRRPGLRIVRGEQGADEPDREKLEAAHKACEKHLDGVVQNISPEDRAEMQDKMVRFAACMREHGIDMPDPDFSGGERGGFRQRIGSSDFDPDDPDFQKADEACREEIFGGDGGPGGPGGGPFVQFSGPRSG